MRKSGSDNSVSPCIGRVDWNIPGISVRTYTDGLSLYRESGLKFHCDEQNAVGRSLSLYRESGLKFFCCWTRRVGSRLSLYRESGLKCSRLLLIALLGSVSPCIGRVDWNVHKAYQSYTVENVSPCIGRVDWNIPFQNKNKEGAVSPCIGRVDWNVRFMKGWWSKCRLSLYRESGLKWADCKDDDRACASLPV